MRPNYRIWYKIGGVDSGDKVGGCFKITVLANDAKSAISKFYDRLANRPTGRSVNPDDITVVKVQHYEWIDCEISHTHTPTHRR